MRQRIHQGKIIRWMILLWIPLMVMGCGDIPSDRESRVESLMHLFSATMEETFWHFDTAHAKWMIQQAAQFDGVEGVMLLNENGQIWVGQMKNPQGELVAVSNVNAIPSQVSRVSQSIIRGGRDLGQVVFAFKPWVSESAPLSRTGIIKQISFLLIGSVTNHLWNMDQLAMERVLQNVLASRSVSQFVDNSLVALIVYDPWGQVISGYQRTEKKVVPLKDSRTLPPGLAHLETLLRYEGTPIGKLVISYRP